MIEARLIAARSRPGATESSSAVSTSPFASRVVRISFSRYAGIFSRSARALTVQRGPPLWKRSPSSHMIDIAREAGLRVKQEVFADRGYNPDGTLVYSFVESVKATYPFYVIRLLGGLLYLGGMLVMCWNVVMTARAGKYVPVRVPAVLAHA